MEVGDCHLKFRTAEDEDGNPLLQLVSSEDVAATFSYEHKQVMNEHLAKPLVHWYCGVEPAKVPRSMRQLADDKSSDKRRRKGSLRPDMVVRESSPLAVELRAPSVVRSRSKKKRRQSWKNAISTDILRQPEIVQATGAFLPATNSFLAATTRKPRSQHTGISVGPHRKMAASDECATKDSPSSPKGLGPASSASQPLKESAGSVSSPRTPRSRQTSHGSRDSRDGRDHRQTVRAAKRVGARSPSQLVGSTAAVTALTNYRRWSEDLSEALVDTLQTEALVHTGILTVTLTITPLTHCLSLTRTTSLSYSLTLFRTLSLSLFT